MTDMWTQRYDRPDYLFGTAPSDFLIEAAGMIAPTDALCVADGEGRHSVWLAEQGFTVTGFDPAVPAVRKARQLAQARGVTVDHVVAGFADWDWQRQFGLVAALFIQFEGPEARLTTFARLRDAVRPGGHVVVQGFAPRQVDYGTGGPPSRDQMYTPAFLRDQFTGWRVLHLRDHDAQVRAGDGHRGVAALVELVAQRPA